MPALVSYINGSLFCFSLIVAIGPQNTYVLRQGLAKHHVSAIVVVCVISDAILIALGAAGVGAMLDSRPAVIEIVRFGGAGFLVAYAFIALKRATQEQQPLVSNVAAGGSLRSSVSTCLAFTWLNPHVYLDTVVLMGAVASAQGGKSQWFAGGAMTASLIWFVALGFGAGLLRPLFSRPTATRALDASIAVVMLCIGVALVHQGLSA